MRRKKQLQDVTRQQISRKSIGPLIYLKQNISRLKKKDPGQIRTHDFAVPGIFFTSRLCWPGTLRKLNTVENKVEMSLDIQLSPFDKVVYGKKIQVPGCTTLAYRKGKQNFHIDRAKMI